MTKRFYYMMMVVVMTTITLLLYSCNEEFDIEDTDFVGTWQLRGESGGNLEISIDYINLYSDNTYLCVTSYACRNYINRGEWHLDKSSKVLTLNNMGGVQAYSVIKKSKDNLTLKALGTEMKYKRVSEETLLKILQKMF